MKSPKDFKRIDNIVAKISDKPKNKMQQDTQDQDKKSVAINLRTTPTIKRMLEDQAFYNKRRITL